MTPPSSSSSDDRVVVAVDFGTTFSGVAYAFNTPGKESEVVSILDWPGGLFALHLHVSLISDTLPGLEGYRQPKVPTLILYDEQDPTKFKWGGEVTWRDPAVHGVKLLLDPDQAKPAYLPNSSFRKDLKELPKDPVDVAADFIGAIYKHALGKIESSSVRKYFNHCEKEFILSVPAVWSDKAKDLTLKVCFTHYPLFFTMSVMLCLVADQIHISGSQESWNPPCHPHQRTRGRNALHLILLRPFLRGW